jgi:hypothetical protein
MDHPPEGPTLGDCLEALGAAQRRELLHTLLVHNPQEEGPVEIDVDDSDEAAGRRRIRLQHVHLPKLEAHGLIEWDRDDDEVSKGPQFEEIRPLLELLVGHEEELPPEDELPNGCL